MSFSLCLSPCARFACVFSIKLAVLCVCLCVHGIALQCIRSDWSLALSMWLYHSFNPSDRQWECGGSSSSNCFKIYNYPIVFSLSLIHFHFWWHTAFAAAAAVVVVIHFVFRIFFSISFRSIILLVCIDFGLQFGFHSAAILPICESCIFCHWFFRSDAI